MILPNSALSLGWAAQALSQRQADQASRGQSTTRQNWQNKKEMAGASEARQRVRQAQKKKSRAGAEQAQAKEKEQQREKQRF